MATVEQIEQDLAAIEKAVGAIAAELHSAYTIYLTALGQAVRQQLILASYHLCTQGYPEVFLSLSFNQRQQLQRVIRKSGQQAADQLLAYTRTEEEAKSEVETEPASAQIEESGVGVGLTDMSYTPNPNLLNPPLSPSAPSSNGPDVLPPVWAGLTEISDPPNLDLSNPSLPNLPLPDPSLPSLGNIPDLPPPEDLGVKDVVVGRPPMAKAAPTPQTFPQSSNPVLLSQWQQNLEQGIVNTLRTTSQKANRLLQQAGLLPKKLPEQLLEAAANSSEGAVEHITGPPNLLNLLIETENAQASEESTVTHIVAIHLRLSEIEFADATVRAGRHQVRNLLMKASKLAREYQKKQRERATAQAEAAWRASWAEE